MTNTDAMGEFGVFSPLGELARRTIEDARAIGTVALEAINNVFRSNARRLGTMALVGGMEVATTTEDDPEEPPIEEVIGIRQRDVLPMRGAQAAQEPAEKVYRQGREKQVGQEHSTPQSNNDTVAAKQQLERGRGNRPSRTTGTGRGRRNN